MPAVPNGQRLLGAEHVHKVHGTGAIEASNTIPRPARSRDRWLGGGLIALGIGIAATSLLGPLVADLIDYRIAETPLNQQIGADAFALAVVVPMCFAVAVLALRGHRGAAALALGPATYAMYIFTEEILAPEYIRLPGNNERFFPLFLGVFVIGGAIAVRAWTAIDAERLPAASRRLDRLIGGWLLAFASFMVVGRYLPALADAMSSTPTNHEYLASPTLFWTIAFEDLGFVLPASIAVGVGLLLRRRWASKAVYAVIGWLGLVPVAVAAMAIAMNLNDDPTAAAGSMVLLIVIGLACSLVAVLAYLPLLRRGADPVAATAG